MHINYAIVLFRPLRNMSKDFGDLKITSDLLAILYSYFMPVCSMVYSYFMPVCSIVFYYPTHLMKYLAAFLEWSCYRRCGFVEKQKISPNLLYFGLKIFR